MKKIIDYILKHWKAITIILCVVLMVSLTMCGNANYRKNQEVRFKSEMINAKETMRDSMQTAENARIKHFTDSVQKAEKKISDAAKKEANDLRKEHVKLTKENELLQGTVDSLMDLYGDTLDPVCRQVVYAYQKQVVGLKKDIFVLNKEVLKLRIASTADSAGWAACKVQAISDIKTIKSKDDLLDTRNGIINAQAKQLAKQDGWFNKNKLWIGLGTGLLFGIAAFR